MKPMTGQSGKLTNGVLSSVGWSREQTYVTNLTCTFKKEYTQSDIAACWDRFVDEMANVKPKVILALGAWPVRMLTNMQFKRALGSVTWSDTFGCWVVATWQPAAAFQVSPAIVSDLVRDFMKVPYYIDKPRDFNKVDWELVTDVFRARSVLRRAHEWDSPALDIETKWDKEKEEYVEDVRCIGISNGDETFVFTEDVAEQLTQADWGMVKWGTQNGVQFDAPVMLRDLNVEIEVGEDSMLMSYSLDERGAGGDDEDGNPSDKRVGRHGLKFLSRQWQAAGFYEVDTKTEDDMLLYEYNAKDAAYTSRIIRYFRQRQLEDNVRDVYFNFMMPSAKTFAEQKPYGIYMSPDKIREVAIEWGEKWLAMEEWLVEEAYAYGWPRDKPLNLNSHPQLKKFLTQYLQINTPNTQADTLKEWKHHPWVGEYQSWKRLDKNLRDYIFGVDAVLDSRGYAHPDVFVHGTVSGRVSYHKPAIQTTPTGYQYYDPEADEADPRVEAEILEFRKVRGIVSCEPPKLYVETDYAQAELYTAAGLSNDEQMYADLLTGDFHSTAAQDMWKIDRKDYDDMQWAQVRRESKYITFGVLFFRGAKSLKNPVQGQIGSLSKYTLRECEQFVERWHARYHGHYDWWLEQMAYVRKHGEQVSLSGRKRRYHAPELYGKHLGSTVSNWPIQTTAHDMLQIAYNDAWQLFKRNRMPARPLWDGHDAIYWEVDPRDIDEAVPMIKEVMSTPSFFDFGIPVDAKIGPNWADVIDYPVYKGKQWWDIAREREWVAV